MKCNKYNIILNTLFKEAVKLISDYPKIGKLSDDKNVRLKIVTDYFIVYEMDNENQLIILTIWDVRQNPKKLKLR